MADVGYLSVISSDRWLEHNDRINKQFDLIYGLKFNQKVTYEVVEDRAQFAELARRALDAGVIGAAPKNLRPDLKLSAREAARRRKEGEDIPDWYIRDEHEEKVVAKMVDEWNRRVGDPKLMVTLK
jgi:hypothetical protein